MTAPDKARGLQIKRYGVVSWGNDKGDRSFGVRAYVVGYGWAHMACDGKPAFFETRKEALAFIKQMRSRRDAEGFKK